MNKVTKLSNPLDVWNTCAKIGLFPIKLNNVKLLSIIISYLMNLGYNIHSTTSGIPLLFDYECFIDGCIGKYHDMFAKQKLGLRTDQTNLVTLLIKDFSNELIKYNTVGINNSAFGAFNINEVNIISVVCSDYHTSS